MMISAKAAAERLGVQEGTLAVLRSAGSGMPFYTEAGRVLYDEDDVKEYPAIKETMRSDGQARRNIYSFKIYRGRELVTVLRRKGATLETAVASLMLYPSLQGCNVKLSEPLKVKADHREKLRKEMKGIYGDLFMLFTDGGRKLNGATHQATLNKFEELVDKAIDKATKH